MVDVKNDSDVVTIRSRPPSKNH